MYREISHNTGEFIWKPFIDTCFIAITSLGTPEFYTLFLPGIYWCFDKKYAARIITIFFISSWTNSVLKNVFSHPRPFDLNGLVKVSHAGGPGLPSGHAQQTVALWGSLVLWLKNRFFIFFAVFIILTVSFSRIYLGVHFPTDVFAGWILGLIIITVMWLFFDRIEDFIAAMNPANVVVAALMLPMACSFILPTRWSVLPAGALSGFFMGIILEREYLEFKPASSVRNGVIRVLSGMFVLSAVLYLEIMIGISKKTPFYLISVYIKSWIMGVWVSYGAPWMFRKLDI
jgi:membrane-associated phospholipid phosphatase